MLLGKEIFHNMFHPSMGIYNDYFYINDKYFPTGYFAMEALNISDESIALLDRNTLKLQRDTLLFLSPKKKSHGSLLQQLRETIAELIRILCKLPPFTSWNVDDEISRMEKVFCDDNLGNIRKPGLERGYFLQYLNDAAVVSEAIKNFRDVGRFFEEKYLRSIPRRDESNFAVAANEFFQSGTFLDMIYSQRLDTETFSLSPSLRAGCGFAYDREDKERMVFLNTVAFDSYMDFFTYDLINGMHHGHAPSLCQNCGRYFLTTDARKPKYCYRMAVQNPHYTCRQYGAMNQQKEKNSNHPIFQVYSTRTGTIRKHHNRGKITDEMRREALKVCEELRDRALFDVGFARVEYLRCMQQEAVYAEAKKRLENGTHHDK